MNYRAQLNKLIEKKNGLVLTEDVDAKNVPRHYLALFVKEDKLERVSRGVYLAPDTFDDEMYRLQAKNRRIIFSHETALYLHDLTDRDPIEWSVTVPYGYNATHLRKVGVKVYTVKKELYQLGVTEGKTLYGRLIQIYNRERTICDIVRNRNNMDVAILNDAIRRYLKQKDKNIPLLLRYAGKLNVQNTLRGYLEILL
ncbi:type IV toxin-antitoxin system AbiEi family antitoxin domain-containing protein [Syntrophomonas wolfei]|mgnify:CR=1 FL=1|jgi:predicted transcriptional regulator of viral defense system|uniref:type IV toxin-antitoxin system AbiEi family antitoxin domain-containing protein n=1 Tax=Syntrophomonas wolfei TaxID=863 RepID=UPI000772DD87|nr:type IV toxin-antitoxin system AbiEi family antitoxin domain-containing protein [Syntrophomonas wolfei]